MLGLFPCRFAFPRAFRPNSTSLVFSGCSVRPYLANRFGKTFIIRLLRIGQSREPCFSPGRNLSVGKHDLIRVSLKQYVITDIRVGDIVVRVYGETATAAYPYYQRATSHGDDLTGDYVILDVWRKQGDNSWKISARYSTRFNRTASQNEQMGQPK